MNHVNVRHPGIQTPWRMHTRHVRDVDGKRFLVRSRMIALFVFTVFGTSNIFNMTFATEFFRWISDVWKSVWRLRVDATMLGKEVSGNRNAVGSVVLSRRRKDCCFTGKQHVTSLLLNCIMNLSLAWNMEKSSDFVCFVYCNSINILEHSCVQGVWHIHFRWTLTSEINCNCLKCITPGTLTPCLCR